MTRYRLMNWILCSLAAAMVIAGCSSDTTSGETTGALSLSLELGDGVHVDEVAWTITQGATEVRNGTIDTSAPGSTISVEYFGLLPGSGYTITLSADTVAAKMNNGTADCRGSKDFSVEVGKVTDLYMYLQCTPPETLGGVRVNGELNVCATVKMASAAPLQTSVGNQIDLKGMYADKEGDTVKHVWSAAKGTIADPSALITTYTCKEVGDDLIVFKVSDDEFKFCRDDHGIPVTCVGHDGGAGGTGGDGAGGDGGAGGEGGMAGAGGEGGAGGMAGAGGEGGGGGSGGIDLCQGVTCDDTQCTNGVCNTGTGLCDDVPTNEDGPCDGGTCMSGECVPASGCTGDDNCSTGEVCISGDCIQDGDCIQTNGAPIGPSNTTNLEAICNSPTYWNDANADCGTVCQGIAGCVRNCLQGIPSTIFAYMAWDPNVNLACATCYAGIQTCIADNCVWRLSDGTTNCAQGDPDCTASGPCAPPNDPLGAACNACQATNGCDSAFDACAGDTTAACMALAGPTN